MKKGYSKMSQHVLVELEMPDALDQFALPVGVDERLHHLLSRQDQGDDLTLAERKAARREAVDPHSGQKAALSDLDNPPLTDEELKAFERVPDAKAIRTAFNSARVCHYVPTLFGNSARLGTGTLPSGSGSPRRRPRSVTLLRVIARDPPSGQACPGDTLTFPDCHV